MRQNGVRSVEATCELCQHEAVVSCHALLARLLVPDAALRLRCFASGPTKIVTQPNRTE
jgi:hypothetical protein